MVHTRAVKINFTDFLNTFEDKFLNKRTSFSRGVFEQKPIQRHQSRNNLLIMASIQKTN
jgi:hypothetical protein